MWCRHHAVQLLCRYFFPLCWNSSLYQPTQGYCHYVSEIACFAEGQHYDLSLYISMCNTLPSRSFGMIAFFILAYSVYHTHV